MTGMDATPVARRPPALKPIGWEDIAAALRLGLADFLRAPRFGLFFGAVYAVGGLAIFAFVAFLDTPWMILPIAIGFPLIGPFVAAGLYEVSRLLATGAPLGWRAVLVTVFRQRERQLGWMAFVVLFVFWIWLYQVRLLLALFLGFRMPATIEGFLGLLLTTQDGLVFLAVGTLVGLILALVLFSACVLAMPMLLDTELDFVTAMIVSVRTVAAHPVPMLGWGVVVTALTLLALAPAFLGLLVVLPVLGHATWHLYARARDGVAGSIQR